MAGGDSGRHLLGWPAIRALGTLVGLERATLPLPEATRYSRLTSRGTPASIFVVPADSQIEAVADYIKAEIFNQSGVHIPVIPDTEIATAEGRLLTVPSSTLITFGNLNNNTVIAYLYHRRLSACDAAYPGTGGFVCRTIHRPFGNNHNLIIVGASATQGLHESARYLIERIEDVTGDLRVDDVAGIEIDDNFTRRYPALEFDPTEEYCAEEIDAAYRRIREGGHRGITPHIAQAGYLYHLTAKPHFARLFISLQKILSAHARTSESRMWSPWGRAADFQALTMIPAWEMVEYSPVIGYEDRCAVAAELLAYTRNNLAEVLGHRTGETDRPRHNHYTFAAIGLFYGALYFGERLGLHDVDGWLELVDECFAPCTRGWKPEEDSNYYHWLTVYHSLIYALLKPVPAFIRGGSLEQSLEFAVSVMDNFGYHVPYGDCREYDGTWLEVPFMKMAHWALGEVRYKPFVQKKERRRPFPEAIGRYPPLSGLYPPAFEYDSEMPVVDESRSSSVYVHNNGLRIIPVDGLYYRAHRNEQSPPPDSCFDKIMYRAGPTEDDDYLLLSGMFAGGHAHDDGNSILRLAFGNRIWLADGDYPKSGRRFHNTVMIFKDGRSEPSPAFVRLLDFGTLGDFGYTATAVERQNDTDWIRHILWRRNEYVVVLDEIRAREDGSYDIRSIFRTIGTSIALSDERRVSVRQTDAEIEFLFPDSLSTSSVISVRDEAVVWGSWQRYKPGGGDAEVRVLERRSSLEMSRGNRTFFCTLIHDTRRSGIPDCLAVTESAFRLIRDSVGTVVGPCYRPVGGCSDCLRTNDEDRPVRIDSRFCARESTGLSMFGLKNITIGCDFTLHFIGHVNARIPDNEPDCTISLQVHGSSRLEVESGETNTSAKLDDEILTLNSVILDDGSHILRVPGLPPIQSSEKVAPTTHRSLDAPEPLRERETPARPVASRSSADIRKDQPLDLKDLPTCAAAGERVVVGTRDGRVIACSENAIDWEFLTGSRIGAVCSDDIDGDGVEEIVAGSVDEYLYVLSSDGSLRWKSRMPYYEHPPAIRTVLTAGFEDVKGRTLVVGTAGSRFYAFTPKGDEIWRYEINHGATCAAACDIDGDGNDELVLGTEWRVWHGVDSQGKRLWTMHPDKGPGANRVVLADIDGDKNVEALFAAVDGNIYCLHAGTGERKWLFPIGDEATDLALAPLDNGKYAIVAGCYNGYVFIINAEGLLIRSINVQEAACCIAVDRGNVLLGTTSGALLTINQDWKQIKTRMYDGPIVAIVPPSPDRISPCGAVITGSGTVWRL